MNPNALLKLRITVENFLVPIMLKFRYPSLAQERQEGIRPPDLTVILSHKEDMS